MLLDLSNLSGDERLLSLCIACAAGIGLIFFAFRHSHRYRLIADTPTSKIRSAVQGYTELEGHIIETPDLPLLLSPLGNRECVWYRYSVDRQVRDEKKTRWVSERNGSSSQWFQLDDKTGTCMIDPEGAEVQAVHKYTWYGDTLFPTAIGNSGLHNFDSSMLGSRYRYTEHLLFPHEKLYALGQFQTVGGGRDKLDLEHISGELIRQWKQNYQQLLERYDSDNDGQIDLDEWQQVKQDAWRMALIEQEKVDNMPTVNVLDKPPIRDRPLLLSSHDQKKLIRRYKLTSLALNALGVGALYIAAELIFA